MKKLNRKKLRKTSGKYNRKVNRKKIIKSIKSIKKAIIENSKKGKSYYSPDIFDDRNLLISLRWIRIYEEVNTEITKLTHGYFRVEITW
jgi:predicted HNH restriction endonuclease